MSSTYTTSKTFTRTHARHLGSKVAADLRQCSLFYDAPDPDAVADYEAELVELLTGGYMDRYEFGFKRDGKRILSWRYVVGPDGDMDSVTGDAGSLYALAKTIGASYYNFVSYSDAWWALTPTERDKIKQALPISRASGSLPGDGNGYWAESRDYGAGGVRVTRQEFRPR